MLVEHSFVTTMDREPAFRAVELSLSSIGFQRIEAPPQTLELRRGRDKPHANGVGTLPQAVRVDFDRGRVVVAASIQEHRKPTPRHRDLMLAVVRTVQLALSPDVSSTHGPTLQDVDAEISAYDRKL